MSRSLPFLFSLSFVSLLSCFSAHLSFSSVFSHLSSLSLSIYLLFIYFISYFSSFISPSPLSFYLPSLIFLLNIKSLFLPSPHPFANTPSPLIPSHPHLNTLISPLPLTPSSLPSPSHPHLSSLPHTLHPFHLPHTLTSPISLIPPLTPLLSPSHSPLHAIASPLPPFLTLSCRPCKIRPHLSVLATYPDCRRGIRRERRENEERE